MHYKFQNKFWYCWGLKRWWINPIRWLVRVTIHVLFPFVFIEPIPLLWFQLGTKDKFDSFGSNLIPKTNLTLADALSQAPQRLLISTFVCLKYEVSISTNAACNCLDAHSLDSFSHHLFQVFHLVPKLSLTTKFYYCSPTTKFRYCFFGWIFATSSIITRRSVLLYHWVLLLSITFFLLSFPWIETRKNLLLPFPQLSGC